MALFCGSNYIKILDIDLIDFTGMYSSTPSPVMEFLFVFVTYTIIQNITSRNVCSAFNPSKCTHTQSSGQPMLRLPGEQSGVRCLVQGSHLSRGNEGGETALYSLRVNAEELKAGHPLHGCLVDGDGCVFSALSPVIHHQLLGLVDVE